MLLSAAEVSKHNSRRSCWVIISGQAYDLTDFLDDHPGGPSIILRYAGRDATAEYEPVHPKGTIEKHLSSDKHMGPIHPNDLIAMKNEGASHPYHNATEIMPISVVQNLDDIEAVAKAKLSKPTLAYFNSAADSLNSFDTNRSDWSKISFRPRVLRDVSKANMQCKVMGIDSELPIFISPAARARMGHPEGEMCLARGASKHGIVYCASTYSSIGHDDLITAFQTEDNRGALAFQLYVPKQKDDAEKLIAQARSIGCTALVVTVDTPVLGKREEDERCKAEMEADEDHPIPRIPDPPPGSEKPVLRGYHSYTLNWDDLNWLESCWNKGREGKRKPFILKGIQTVEDAVLACEYNVDAIYLSNHGGRQLDFAPSSVNTLLSIRRFHPEVFKKLDVYVDGGVRRGTDIVKAICLGARGVGMGRPFMYGLSAYGDDGVAKVIQLISDEIETTMRLIGATSLDQLDERYVNCRKLEWELVNFSPRASKL